MQADQGPVPRPVRDPAATAARDERRATTNEAALRFKLRADGVADLADHAALHRFAGSQPDAFRTAIIAFAGVTAPPAALAALLLGADLRPDDRLLVAGMPALPWLRALARVVDAPQDVTPATLRAAAEARQASVVVAPRSWLRAAGLTDTAQAGPRGVCPDDWSDPTALTRS